MRYYITFDNPPSLRGRTAAPGFDTLQGLGAFLQGLGIDTKGDLQRKGLKITIVKPGHPRPQPLARA
jgi:hypothetical protein